MYELASNANEETSSSSEAEGENGEGLLNKTGEDAEERKAGVESESPLCFQKAILEDIRFDLSLHSSWCCQESFLSNLCVFHEGKASLALGWNCLQRARG